MYFLISCKKLNEVVYVMSLDQYLAQSIVKSVLPFHNITSIQNIALRRENIKSSIFCPLSHPIGTNDHVQ